VVVPAQAKRPAVLIANCSRSSGTAAHSCTTVVAPYERLENSLQPEHAGIDVRRQLVLRLPKPERRALCLQSRCSGWVLISLPPLFGIAHEVHRRIRVRPAMRITPGGKLAACPKDRRVAPLDETRDQLARRVVEFRFAHRASFCSGFSLRIWAQNWCDL
jgi:hypothetical protein